MRADSAGCAHIRTGRAGLPSDTRGAKAQGVALVMSGALETNIEHVRWAKGVGGARSEAAHAGGGGARASEAMYEAQQPVRLANAVVNRVALEDVEVCAPLTKAPWRQQR